MPYTLYDPTKPDATAQTLTQMGTSERNNFNALRDACIMGGGFFGFNLATTGGVGTGSITSNVLTITALTSGTFGVGQVISGAGITPAPKITSLGTGTGGTGTYNITTANVGSITITGTNTVGQPETLLYTKGTERVRAALTWGTTGGEAGNVTVAIYSYSSDSGLTYSTIGTKTVTYDGSGNVVSTTWS